MQKTPTGIGFDWNDGYIFLLIPGLMQKYLISIDYISRSWTCLHQAGKLRYHYAVLIW